MAISRKFPHLTAYALLAAVAIWPGLSRAQVYSGIAGNQAALNQTANPYSAASNPYVNGLNGSSSANGSYVEPDISGYLRGSADIITSLGRQQIQQTLSMKEKYKQEQITTERKRLDEYRYEREKAPTLEAERQRALGQQIGRSLNNPPPSNIWSGQALNDVLMDIRRKKGGHPAVLIDEDVVKHINLTWGVGNPGLLKNEGHVAWPLALLSDDYKPQRELLNALAPEVFRQAINGNVDPGTLKSMNEALATLHNKLTANVRDMTANQYIDASRFVGYFGDGLKILARPDAGDLFSLWFSRKGMTVADLTKYMTDKGLAFAPAMTGDESAYQAVHRALVAYDRGTTAEYTARK